MATWYVWVCAWFELVIVSLVSNITTMTESWLISVCVEEVHVCACARSGVFFRCCRKHPTDDCHSNRSGGRRKLLFSWVIFSWTLCSLQHESFSKLRKNVISLKSKKKKSPKQLHREMSAAVWNNCVSSPSTVTDDTSCMCLRRRCSFDVTL